MPIPNLRDQTAIWIRTSKSAETGNAVEPDLRRGIGPIAGADVAIVVEDIEVYEVVAEDLPAFEDQAGANGVG